MGTHPHWGGSPEIRGPEILRDTVDKRAVCVLLKCFLIEIYLRNVHEPLLDKVRVCGNRDFQKCQHHLVFKSSTGDHI